jgi:hypothetical protein
MTRRDTRPLAMTRLPGVRPSASITPIRQPAQPSAWSQALLWGGSLSGLALVLALGFSIVRPTPRRRAPEIPAPAWQRMPQRER